MLDICEMRVPRALLIVFLVLLFFLVIIIIMKSKFLLTALAPLLTMLLTADFAVKKNKT